MVSSTESPVHENWKNAIIAAGSTDTVFLNQLSKPALRLLWTQKTTRLERERRPDYEGPPVTAEFGRAADLYFGGDMESSIALSGQVAGPITSGRPVADIIRDAIAEFHETTRKMAAAYA